MKTTAPTSACPCTPEHDYASCCGRYHAGELAPNAETLMRSRYSAYALELRDYVHATWHASTRPERVSLVDELPRKWLGLQICHSANSDPDHATVEFIAKVKVNGRAFRLHETSRFVREQDRWFYVDGDFHET